MTTAPLPRSSERTSDWLNPTLAALTAAVIIALSHLVFSASPEARTEFPLDDVWIHLDYARGLLTDGFPSYNPGVPEAGFSSPLWLVFSSLSLAVTNLFHLSPVIALKLCSLAFATTASASLGRLTHHLGAGVFTASIVSFVSLLGPWCNQSSVSAMEVSLTLSLCTVALYFTLRHRPLHTGITLALCFISRPECVVLTAVVALWWAITHRQNFSLRELSVLVLPTVALGLLWSCWCLYVTHYPLPNTYYAKTGLRDLTANFTTLSRAFTQPTLGFFIAFVSLTLLGAHFLYRRDRASLALIVCAPTTLIASVIFTRSLSPDAAFCVRRYLYPFIPLFWPLAGLGLSALHKKFSSRTITSLACVTLGLSVTPGLALSRQRHASNCRDIAIFHTRPAELVRALSPVGTRFAVEGAGSSRFHSERTVIDVIGLNTHQLVHARGRPMAYGCTLARSGATWFALPTELAQAFTRVFQLTPVATFHDARYSQAIPPRPHQVLVLRGSPRREYLARCRARFGDRAP